MVIFQIVKKIKKVPLIRIHWGAKRQGVDFQMKVYLTLSFEIDQKPAAYFSTNYQSLLPMQEKIPHFQRGV